MHLQPTLKSRAARAALLAFGVLPLTVLAQAVPVPTATPEVATPPIALEAFTVTGSNIKRMDVERVLPVTVLDIGKIDIRDASQPSELLTALPEITGMPATESNFSGAAARGDNATVSLRGIPSSNTLILLNGRRLAPHPITQSEAGTPTLSTNVNQLPNRGIQSVEVLRDGASSIYGTDAVAGVVNYVMKRNSLGTELVLRFGETGSHDGQEKRATLTHGVQFARGKGRAMITADFYDRRPIFTRDRPFGAEPDNSSRAPAPWNVPTDTAFNLRANSSAYGTYQTGTPSAPDAFGNYGVFTTGRPAGIPANLVATNGTFAITPLAGGGLGIATAVPVRSATGPGHDYYWNSSAYRVIQPKSVRTNIFAAGEFDLTDRITLFADFNMYLANSITYREPDTTSTSSEQFYLVVPVTNPWNPFGTRFWSPTGAPNADGTPRLTGTPAAVSLVQKRFADLPTRVDYVTDVVYRGVAGARGKLANAWTWESALLWSATRGIEYEANCSRRSLLAAAINQTDPAKAFNPFTRTFAVQNGTIAVTGDYQNPASVTATFQSPFIRNGITKLGSADFHASGDVLRIWGGNTIGGAVGGEFRYEAYDDYRPPYMGLNPPGSGLDPLADDFVSFSPNSDTHGNRHVAAAYAEVVVPLVGKEFKLPLVQLLEVTGSGRFERYTDFGSTTKPKFGGNWKPASWIMVRGSYNQGFHAPNLAQLFTGTLTRLNLGVTDTYRSPVTGLPTDGPSNRRSIGQGNPSLQPEKSTGKSGGIVVDVPWVKGLSVSVDYWEIRQRDVVSSGGGIPDDLAALQAATQAALAAGQKIDQIDLGSGTASYKGDPSVLRFPVTQTDRDFFATYNARQAPGNQRAVVGGIDHTLVSYFNKAQQFVNGFDFDASYRLPQLALGNFSVNTNWTLLNNFYAYTAAGAARTEYRSSNSANVGGVTPKWRGSASVSWRRKQWSAGVGYYYVGRYTDVGATTTKTTADALGAPSYIQPIFTNGSYLYRYVVHDTKSYNVYLSYRCSVENRWLKNTDLRLGVNNVLNAKPPLAAGSSQGYDVGAYNGLARGRVFSLQVTKKL